MLQEIISKLGLKETNRTYGVSFVHNVIVYHFEDDIYCAAADTVGYPDKKGMVMFFNGSNYTKMTNEFIMSCPLSEIRKLLSRLAAKK